MKPSLPIPGSAGRRGDGNESAGELGLGAADDVRFLDSKRDRLGNVYYKYQQTYQGVAVVGREIVVQTGADGALRLISGNVEAGIDISTEPALDGGQRDRGALMKQVPVHSNS